MVWPRKTIFRDRQNVAAQYGVNIDVWYMDITLFEERCQHCNRCLFATLA